MDAFFISWGVVPNFFHLVKTIFVIIILYAEGRML